MLSSPYQRAIKIIMREWKRSGASETCGECIKEGHGCCWGCANLKEGVGCVEKPLPCALWTCHKIEQKHPELTRLMHKVKGFMGLPYLYGREIIAVGWGTPVKHEFREMKKETLVQIGRMCR